MGSPKVMVEIVRHKREHYGRADPLDAPNVKKSSPRASGGRIDPYIG
jgi:hypothetical protein